MMVPNLIGKPFSWYNNGVDDEYAAEPDMTGVEENVDQKTD